MAQTNSDSAAQADMVRTIDRMRDADCTNQGLNWDFFAGEFCQRCRNVTAVLLAKRGCTDVSLQAPGATIRSDDVVAAHADVDLAQMSRRFTFHAQRPPIVQHRCADAGAK